MLAKLAWRNVRRQMGNYLIYFITVALTMALMFAVNNIIFNEQLQKLAAGMAEMRLVLILISVTVALITAFVLGYATSFMLKLRQREFGTYLTLGMTRRDILRLFIVETLLLCGAALLCGIGAGLFIYQGLMGLICGLMELQFSFAAYSFTGLVVTLVLGVALYGLAALASAYYLKKVSIYNLLHTEQEVSGQVKRPLLWLAITVLSLVAVAVSLMQSYQEIRRLMLVNDSIIMLLFWLMLLAGAIMLFHIGLARSLVYFLLHSRRLCTRGTATFVLRQLSGRLNANALMAGILALLIALAIFCADFSFAQKASNQADLDNIYPFAVLGEYFEGQEAKISLQEAREIIGSYAEITSETTYQVWTSGLSELHAYTPWHGEGYTGLYDSFMRESDYNALQRALGEPEVRLQNQFLLLANASPVLNCDFSAARLELNGQSYDFGGVQSEHMMFASVYMIAVVPDAATEGMELTTAGIALQLADNDYDAAALHEALTWQETNADGYQETFCNFAFREYARLEFNSQSAIIIVGALYLALVFVCMAVAVLALKTLSGLADDRRRYAILSHLGAAEREQSQALFRQICCFFFLPFVLPVLLSIPLGFIFAAMLQLLGYPELISAVCGAEVLIVLVIFFIYALYFSVTYLIARRYVLS